MQKPRLRHVDLDPVEVEGEQLYSLSDPSGIVEEVLLLHPGAAFLVMHFDGEHDISEIHAKAEAQFNGDTLPENMIPDLVQQLDDFGFLDSPAYVALFEGVLKDFRDASTRPSALAGRSFPEDPEELRTFLDLQFIREGSVGTPCPEPAKDQPSLPGLIAPHIDLHRGGHCYSHGYHALAAAGTPDAVIIFGVAHAAQPVPFILTRKDFDTPLCTMPTNKELVDRLAAASAWDPFEFEFSHKAEHSIEFQALMLSYVYGPTVQIVPILTSCFGEDGEFLDEGEDGSLHKFLNECRAIVNEANGKISVVASVDLAHVGRCFGDDFDIDEDVVASVEDRDREDLENVLNVDPAAFYRSVQRDNNLRNVCGVNAIYSGLYTLQDSVQNAEILHYDFARDPADGIVSFTSIALR